MTVREIDSFEEKLKEVLRIVGALILSSKYKRLGVPVSKVKKIFNQYNIPFNHGLEILEEKLNELGIHLKRIKYRQGSKFADRLIAIIDPSLNIEDLSFIDKTSTAILGLIFLKNNGGYLEINELLKDVSLILNDDKNEAKIIIDKALNKLVREGIIKIVNSELIMLTELGLALSPPRELLDQIAIEMLLSGKSGEVSE